jgi:hypothetical protein
MGREVPFYKDAICDGCGKVGAYDFMGDCFCPECCDKNDREAEEAQDRPPAAEHPTEPPQA